MPARGRSAPTRSRPQTHIVEGLSRPRAAPASSRRASSSTSSRSSPRCRSRSAPRRPARAPTRRPRARACSTWPRRSTTPPGLGLPIVMTVANRAIGAPINIWNDHSDSMSQRDSRLDPALRRVQPGGGRPAHPGVPARRGAVAAGDGLHGRLHPHPRRTSASTCPTQEQVDAFLPPFEPRQVLDPDDPVTIGAMVGPEAFTEVKYLMHAKQMQALDADPRDRRASSQRRFGRASGGLVRGYRTDDAETIVVALGSVLGTIEDVVDELRERGRAASARSAIKSLPARSRSTRCAPRSATRSASSCSRRRSRSASAGSSARTCGSRSRGCRLHGLRRRRRPRRPADHQARRCTRLFARRARRPARAARPSSTSTASSSSASSRAHAASRRSGPHAENILRDLGIVAAQGRLRGGAVPSSRSSSTRRAASRSATGCSTPSSARCRPTRSARTRSPPATAPARAAARRSARATRSTPRCARPTAG